MATLKIRSRSQNLKFPRNDVYLCQFGQNLAIVCLFVFVALRPMSTAMVIAGRSVHLTTLFPGQA